MRGFLENVPLFLPVFLVLFVAGLGLSSRIASTLGTRQWIGTLLAVSVGLIIAATLTPVQSALDGSGAHPGTCDLRRVGLADVFRDGLRLDDARLNILLFLPLGVTIALLPRSPWKLLLFITAVMAPLLVELSQFLVPLLGRGCQSADVVDNMTGLVIGMGVGLLAARTLRLYPR